MTDAQSLATLATAGREPPLPLRLALPETGALTLNRWLRILPGKRYAGMGQWRGQPVFAKLLVGSKAERQYTRECAGAARLAECAQAAPHALATPRLLTQGFVSGVGGWLLFEWLEDAESLSSRWQTAPTAAARDHLLGMALRACAALYRQGVWQADPHPDNLLFVQNRLYLIDGGDIRMEAAPLPIKRQLDNLGLFFAQLPEIADDALPALLAASALFSTPLTATQTQSLQNARAKARHWRMRDLLDKCFRDCSLFVARPQGWRGMFGRILARRDAAEWLTPLLANPDALLQHGLIYKNGGSATVARIECAGHALVVKRYNVKRFWRGLRRCWRLSRAARSWREAHRLLALGIPTARPLALIERRFFWLTGTAWFIAEHLPGENLVARLAHHGGHLPSAEQTALENLLAALARENISHGDLKGHNLILQEAEDEKQAKQWALIDLDAMRQHRFACTFRRAHARDCARLQRNFSEAVHDF
ncbi:MAG: hypothetical protein LBR88_08780 [Zoogloeaceae bacterium]|nr:hypothetical protein [Zoogloeaceae bacterium]